MSELSLARTLEETPLGDLVGTAAYSILSTQHALDMLSLRAAELMTGKYHAATVDALGREKIEEREAYVHFDGERLSLLELGFTPTFYQFVETKIEVKISFSMSREQAKESTVSQSSSNSQSRTDRHGFLGLGGSTTTTTARATSVDARFASRFQYNASGASVVSTRLVPVPPPALLLEKAHELVEENRSGNP